MISSLQIDGVGRLSHKGASRSWSGEIRLRGEPRPVDLTIRGTPEGPTPGQVAALLSVVEAWAVLKEDAAEGLAELIQHAGLEDQSVWDVLVVSDVHVPQESYDPAGIHVLVTVEHVEHPDVFRPAVDVCGGVVVAVLIGT